MSWQLGVPAATATGSKRWRSYSRRGAKSKLHTAALLLGASNRGLEDQCLKIKREFKNLNFIFRRL
jgi:hypothetical protein